MAKVREFAVADTLKDGTPITVRAIRPDDRDRLLRAFRLLERESVYTRFFSPHRDVSDAQLDRAVNVDFDTHVALAVTVRIGDSEAIIATARYVKTAERSAEVAFVVEEDCQGRGIASRLLAHLADIARTQGITQFEADVLAENASMLKVFRRSGFALKQTRDGGLIHLTLALP